MDATQKVNHHGPYLHIFWDSLDRVAVCERTGEALSESESSGERRVQHPGGDLISLRWFLGYTKVADD